MREVPPPYPEYYEHWTAPTREYRVVLWEQPVMEGLDPERIGWGEMTIDLVEIEDVHEAIECAERLLAKNEGPYSRGGNPVRDREYVLYAKVPDEERFLQIAGWDPTRNLESDNLRRGDAKSRPRSRDIRHTRAAGADLAPLLETVRPCRYCEQGPTLGVIASRAPISCDPAAWCRTSGLARLWRAHR